MAMLLRAIQLRYDLLRSKSELWFRPVLALIMVSTAALGAGAAYWATEAEEQTILLKQRLVVGRFQEVALWSQYAQQFATSWTFKNEENNHKELGLRLSRTADRIREADFTEAARLDFQAQEEFGRARLYRTFYHFLRGSDETSTIDEFLPREVSRELRQFGFGVDDTGPKASPDKSQAAGEATNGRTAARDLWKSFDERIEQAHSSVLFYSQAVVLYVLALVLFTFADLNLRSASRSGVLTGIGLGIVAVTSAFAISNDFSFLYVVATVLVIACLTVWFASLSGLLLSVASEEEEPLHAHEIETKGFWGASLILHHSSNARSRMAITLIAISVFLSSLVGYFYVVASKAREDMAHEALVHQVAFADTSTTSTTHALAGQLQPAIDLLANQFHCAAALQQELFPRQAAEKQVTEFGGVGVEIKTDGGIVVVATREDGPAARAGVRAGDTITHIDGQSIELIPLNTVANRLRGTIGSSVILRIARSGVSSPIELDVIRGKVIGDFRIAENGESRYRNTTVACEGMDTKKVREAEKFIQNADYEGGFHPGHDLFYRTFYRTERGNPARLYAMADGY